MALSSDDEEYEQRPGAARSWWQRLRDGPGPSPPQQTSGYLTLIPLSDSRLKPQNTNLIVSVMLILAVAAVAGVWVLVPRGITVGSIEVHSSQISFNTSKSTYQILLTATMPVFNPNYLSVRLSGTVNVSFYDQQAGYALVGPVDVPARAQPQVVNVEMDASSVPQKYLFTIYTQCFTFPEKLIFFLLGSLQAEYLGKQFDLPAISTFFIISCNQSGPDKKAQLALQTNRLGPGLSSPLRSHNGSQEHAGT
ncbi:hypothetical protein V8C86DRAFT_2536887 [Haematococcus lacustris]